MIAISQRILKRTTINSVLTDVAALVFIYFVPTISHLTGLPVYLIEPMRFMLILSIVHTNRNNAYLLALSMPLFSFIISGHPVLPKMILITSELLLNVFLFYFLTTKVKNTFISIIISIVVSKAIYYLAKLYLISLAITHTEIIATPIIVQLITTVLFSLYLFKFYSENKHPTVKQN